MHMMPGRTATCKFECCVATWVLLLDSPQDQALWDSHPAVLTYQWFNVLRSLLEIFAGWQQHARWIKYCGFCTARAGGDMKHLLTLNGNIGPDDSVQLALRYHDMEVKRKWDVCNLHTTS